MRRFLPLAFGLVLLIPQVLSAETFRVEKTEDGAVRTLARVLEGKNTAASAASSAAGVSTAAVETARQFLHEKAAVLGLAGVTLGETSALQSAGGLHVTFPTLVDDPSSPAHGLPIHLGEVAVHQTLSGEVLLVTNHPRGDLLTVVRAGTGPVLSEADAVQRAMDAVSVSPPFIGTARASLIAARTARGYRRAWQVELPPGRPLADWLVIVDEQDGSILFETNRQLHARATSEVTGSGLVFDPNPITASGDSSLEDTSDVDSYRVQRSLPGLDGSGYLRGPFVDTKPLRDGVTRANEASFQYNYSRNNAFFEEANAYYHIDHFQRRLQNLGFQTANNRQIQVDVHYTSEDNSYYRFFERALVFGDGGVDDAEDSEIIIHEYGHAIHHNIVPGLGAASESSPVRALSEGWSDYFAASYGNDPCIGEWDASSYSLSLPPCLRRTDAFLVWPDNLSNEVHRDGEIWSSALWAVRDSLRQDVTDRLAIESYYFTSASSGFQDAGWALVLADWTLYGGQHLSTIESILGARGLLPHGEDVLLTDNDAARIAIGFTFTFFGVDYDSVYVGSNGNLTFEGPDTSPAGNPSALAAGNPRIALYWTDLDPSSGGVEVQHSGGLLSVHYVAVPVAGETAPVGASVSLFGGTNMIQMIYETAPAAAALVGIGSGGGASPVAADLTNLPVSSTTAGVIENFAAQPGTPFALQGHSLLFVPAVDGTYQVRDPNIETSVVVTEFEAIGERGDVRLRWVLPEGADVVGFRVERAAAGEPSMFLGGVQNSRSGENEFVDTGVQTGIRYRYWVHLQERGGQSTTIGPVTVLVQPLPFALLAPNPFRPGSIFRVEGAGPGEVSIAIFDVRGRRVRELRATEASGAVRQIVWRGEDDGGRMLSAGIYFVRLRGDGALLTRRILLMR